MKKFPGVDILWKGTVSTEFRATLRKLRLSTKFSWKLGESPVFYAVFEDINKET